MTQYIIYNQLIVSPKEREIIIKYVADNGDVEAVSFSPLHSSDIPKNILNDLGGVENVICVIDNDPNRSSKFKSTGYIVIEPEDIAYYFGKKKENKKIEENIEDSSKFKKFDADKIDMGLMPGILIEALTTVGSHGARKYGKYNYIKAKLEDIHRYHSAFMRHYFGYYNEKEETLHGFINGNIKDHDSGLNELWQAFWNLGAIIEACEKYGYEKVSEHLRGD